MFLIRDGILWVLPPALGSLARAAEGAYSWVNFSRRDRKGARQGVQDVSWKCDVRDLRQGVQDPGFLSKVACRNYDAGLWNNCDN